jgi:hypothetical protein
MTIALKSNISGTSGAIQINGTDVATVDANGNLTATGTISGSSAFSFRNKIINGNFDFWQRATSQTTDSYGSDDRWFNGNVGSTKTHSRQAFALGQTAVPNNPQFFSRTVVTSVANAANYVVKQQRIEDVTLSSDKTMTLSFWAKADANKNIAVEFVQLFGTGGSPSAQVTGIGVTTFALTTSWQKFTTTVTFPSVAGKTLGTNNDDNYYFNMWFDAGSSNNARTNSLGQQSGTFDIAQVQLEEGTIATPFETRPLGVELALCQRYYFTTQGISLLARAYDIANGAAMTVWLPTTMRATPTCTVVNDTAGVVVSTIPLAGGNTNGHRVTIVSTRSGSELIYGSATLTASAEL